MADTSIVQPEAPIATPVDTSKPDASVPSPLIVTSNASRSTFNEGVSTLQDATLNLQKGNMTATPMTDTTVAQEGAAKADGWKPASTVVQTNPDGSTTHTTTAEGAPPKENATDASGGKLDPAVQKQFEDSNAQLDQGINDAKASLASVTATLANDPAAAAAVAQIGAQYAQLYAAQQAKNKIIMGSYTQNAARSGALQFANDMTTQFLNDEQDRANQRLADIVTRENNAIMKSNAAYKAGDVKAFSAATKELKDAQTAKTKGISDLAKATNEALKTFQAQQKAQATQAKQQITDNIRISTANASIIAKNLKDSNITDPKKREAYIAGMAAKLGINDPSYLESAVSKIELSNKNTESTINKREQPKAPAGAKTKGGTDGGYKYTPDDVATYTSLMNKGGTDPTGKRYNGRGADGYVDPGTYIAAFNDWVNINGGTPQGFVKQFPVTNVNPDSYTTLPKALQPKAKASGAGAIPPA